MTEPRFQPEHDEAVAYKFDLVTVTTVDVRTRYGADAARQAVASVEEFEAGGYPAHDAQAPDVAFTVTCAAPRGRAYLVSATDASGEGLPDPADDECDLGDENLPEPICDVKLATALIAEMWASLDALEAAADGDSNDHEIECGKDCADHLTLLLETLGFKRPGTGT